MGRDEQILLDAREKALTMIDALQKHVEIPPNVDLAVVQTENRMRIWDLNKTVDSFKGALDDLRECDKIERIAKRIKDKDERCRYLNMMIGRTKGNFHAAIVKSAEQFLIPAKDLFPPEAAYDECAGCGCPLTKIDAFHPDQHRSITNECVFCWENSVSAGWFAKYDWNKTTNEWVKKA